MFAIELHTVKSGRFLAAALCGALAPLLLSLSLRSTLAQEADGDFAGDKTWTDKAGQKHDIKAPNIKDSKIRQALNKVATEGKTSSDTEEELFENWSQYLAHALTWRENITNLPNERRELKKQLIRLGKATAPNLHDRLNDLALQLCTAVAKDPRYPRAVRINCTLMLGDLDEREYNAGANQQSVSLPAATSALVDLIADEKQQLFIRLEAMIALMRHTQPNMPAAIQTKAVDALLNILKTPVPEDKSLAGHVWLRFRASDLLLVMIETKLPVDQAAMATSLSALLSDEKLPTWARAAYAGDLGRLDGKSLPAAQNGPTIRALATLMLTILQASPFLPDESAEEEAQPDDGGKKDDKKSEKKDTKKDEKGKDEKKDDKKSAEAPPLSPAAQKLLSEEMMWQLARIRRALYGKDAPTGKEKGPDATLGLYAAASDADKAIAKKIVGQLDDSVKTLTEVPNSLGKVADTLQKAVDTLEDVLTGPEAEQAQTAMADKAKE
jgi:hypothetical protein